MGNSLKPIPVIESEIMEDIKFRSIPGLTSRISVYNNLDTPIIVSTRDGFKNKMNPVFIPRLARGVYFVIQQVVSESALMDVTLQLEDANHPFFGKARATYTGRTETGMIELSTAFLIKPEELSKRGGYGYNRYLDAVVSTLDVAMTPYHPYCPNGTRQLLTGDEDVGLFGIKILLIDNQRVFNKPFVNIGGKVYQIEPMVDYGLNSGLYYTASNEIGEDGTIISNKTEYYSIEEIINKKSPIVFYTEYKDAKNACNEDIKKLEMAQTLRDTEFEQKMKMLQQEQMLSNIEAERKRLEHERSIESTMRKDYYEERSYSRKDSSELWKLIPAVVGGALLVKKLFFE